MALSALVLAVAIPLLDLFWSTQGSHHRSLIITLCVISYILASVGIAAFEANVVQFGLDQLMESSSRYLSLYLHLLVWIRQAGVAVTILPYTFMDCDHIQRDLDFRYHGYFMFAPFLLFILLSTVPLVTLVRKRKGFYREFGDINPYKMVIKVIVYVLKNPHPRHRRSAFFYYGPNPGRMDNSKIPFGGPFETEHVENVKTVLQMLVVIVCVGPVFILRVSASYSVYQHFVQHYVNSTIIEQYCPAFWPLIGSGNQINLIGILLYPIYILVLFKVFKSIPRILLRVLVGLVLITLSQVCFLMIEVVGHISNDGTVQCALLTHNSTKYMESSLDIPWGVLIPPNLLNTLAIQILFTTIFEFISAQSPKPMTGLLIGTFFFTEGIFELLGMVLVLPFTEGRLWKHRGTHTYNSTVDDDPLEYTLVDTDFWEEGLAGTDNTTFSVPWVATACEM